MNSSFTVPVFFSFPGLYALILAPGGKAAADVPLGLVEIQQHAHLPVQSRIHMRQALGQVLVYGGFGNAEFLRGGADGGPVLDDVLGQVAGPFL